ncbi:MAG: YtcA family lipoprotein [Candidatus Binatus sp.]
MAKGNRFALTTAAALVLGGCDPVINIAGANFPSWLFCAICGAILTVAIRPVLVVTRVEPYLWPLPVVCLSLTILMGCIVWLIFFSRI